MARKKTTAPDVLPGTTIKLPPALVPLLRPIEEIYPDAANPRRARDVHHLVGLMRRFGYTDPVVVNAAGMIEAGHQRYAAALLAGATAIPVVGVDHDGLEALAFNIAHNRSQEVVAEWDRDALAPLLRRLQEEDALDGLGWDGDDLAQMLTKDEPVDPSADPDPEVEEEIPDPPAEPVTKAGEIITLGPHTLHCADCMDVLRSMPDNSVDSIVTDPPYGLSPDGRARTWDDIEALRAEGKGPRAGFMGRAWDAGVPGITWARECLRVLKPGGHLIAFSATRTYHRLACSVEDAGFLIRDMEAWLYWQGFPKSHDISKAIDAEAGAERAVIGHRPGLAGGGFGDVGHGLKSSSDAVPITVPATPEAKRWSGWGTAKKPAFEPAVVGQKPISESTIAANVLKWGTGGLNIDACRIAQGDPAWPGPNDAVKPLTLPKGNRIYGDLSYRAGEPWDGHPLGRFPANIYYCPKPAARERNEGCDSLPQRRKAQLAGAVDPNDPVSERFLSQPMGNVHPTVKPTKLWRWLLRLVTPPGGTCFEPFGGSGTALVAARGLDMRVIVVEREPSYCDIIRARADDVAVDRR